MAFRGEDKGTKGVASCSEVKRAEQSLHLTRLACTLFEEHRRILPMSLPLLKTEARVEAAGLRRKLVLHTDERPIVTDLLVASVPAAIGRFVEAGGKVIAGHLRFESVCAP
jgi:hypothetical protein